MKEFVNMAIKIAGCSKCNVANMEDMRRTIKSSRYRQTMKSQQVSWKNRIMKRTRMKPKRYKTKVYNVTTRRLYALMTRCLHMPVDALSLQHTSYAIKVYLTVFIFCSLVFLLYLWILILNFVLIWLELTVLEIFKWALL